MLLPKQNERIQMKTFNELKESLLTEKKVKVGDQTIVVTKAGDQFKVTIDGEHLDNYDSEKDAIKMAKEFIKQFSKGKG